ncbi:uncharacterized protein PHACADRAFT_251126 [Phanerochaete carnosa HHB-10118-sp]|uniref:Uncharacterized protein n=1 Tax=Phanerochaete carnosa (strain HHB-10118-sp) TaxID=650164 RepID=K5WDV6_PHACS|nr:uncharacterized protein PHACADRAFT_251126 [Phanerochaete carnosa HHB-10118-sp]EKM57465.1 hypothetical protein PHACADRAFT_251126 [Phanerochaete carnosa HHB-10118-sp]
MPCFRTFNASVRLFMNAASLSPALALAPTLALAFAFAHAPALILAHATALGRCAALCFKGPTQA